MGLHKGGLLSGGGGPANSLVPGATGSDLTLSGLMTALRYLATAPTGTDAFYVAANGARFHIGLGTDDYFSSDATRIIAAGILQVVGSIELPTNATLYLDGTARTIGFVQNGSAVKLIGVLPLTPASDQNQNLGATAVRWSNLFATGLNIGVSGALTHSATAPTVVAGAGAAVTAGGACAFDINLGGAAQTGTITLPAAVTGWVVTMQNVTTPASFVLSQTGGNTTTATFTCYSRTTGLAINWNANDHARCTAVAY